MSKIVPYNFEGANIRALEIDGEPYFVGKDVAEALGYTNPSKAIGDHCKGVAKRYPLQTGGGTQEVRVLSEPDMLRLIVNSTLPAAERFERWVFEDVLPSIRKTGSYSAPQAAAPRASLAYREAAAITRDHLKVCKLLGVDEGMAKVITAKQVRIATGLDFTPLLTTVTATQTPHKTIKELAALIGGGATSEFVNRALEQLGFQVKEHWTNRKGQPRSKWSLTDAGKKYGALAPYQAEQNEHSGFRAVWLESVLDFVRPLVEIAIAERANAKPTRSKATPVSPPAPQAELL